MDIVGRLKNESHAVVDARPEIARDGRDVAVVIAKLAYTVDAKGAVRLDFAPVRWAPSRDGEGGWAAPDDGGHRKLGTDVGVVGTARPPSGRPTEMLAWVSVGPLRKVLRVVGRRRFVPQGGAVVASPPDPLEPTPLCLANAWGGREPGSADDDPEAILAENPAGRGFSRTPSKLLGHDVPAVEPPDPGAASRLARAQATFAPIPRTFEPRRARQGTFDAAWATTRNPLPPLDFDPRHDWWAAHELHSEAPLTPDAPIEVGGMHRDGPWRFTLPRYAPTFAATVDGRAERHPTHLDAIFLDADEGRVELTWRCVLPLPAKWLRLDRVVIGEDGRLPDAVLYDDPSRDRAASPRPTAPEPP